MIIDRYDCADPSLSELVTRVDVRVVGIHYVDFLILNEISLVPVALVGI